MYRKLYTENVCESSAMKKRWKRIKDLIIKR